MQNLLSLGLMARYREFPIVSPYISLNKTWDPQDGAKFDPRAIILALLVQAYLIRLLAKFGKPRPYGQVQGDLASFPLISPCKTFDPQGKAKFDPRAILWTNLVEAC